MGNSWNMPEQDQSKIIYRHCCTTKYLPIVLQLTAPDDLVQHNDRHCSGHFDMLYSRKLEQPYTSVWQHLYKLEVKKKKVYSKIPMQNRHYRLTFQFIYCPFIFPAPTDVVKTSFKFEIAKVSIGTTFIIAMIVGVTAILKTSVG